MISISCSDISKDLPKDLVGNKIKSIHNYQFSVKVYKLKKSDFDKKNLSNHTINCCCEYKSEPWRRMNLSNKEDKWVFDIIDDTSELMDDNNLDELLGSMNSGASVYFSSCYRVMKGIGSMPYNDHIKMNKNYNIKYFFPRCFGVAPQSSASKISNSKRAVYSACCNMQ